MKKQMVRAFLRKYKVEFSEKYKTRIAIPISDSVIKDFNCPYEAYTKTQRLIKKDYNAGIVQDVWFQYNPDAQLSLF